MDISIEAIIYYVILVDALGANIAAWSGVRGWYQNNFRTFSRYFPLAKGWAAYYLVLVLWVGYALFRLEVLPY